MTVTSHDHLSGHMARVAKALLGAPNQSLTPPASSLSKSFGMNQSSLSRSDRTEMADGNSGAGRPPERGRTFLKVPRPRHTVVCR